MVTTLTNKIQYRQLRLAIIVALTGDAATRFDTCTKLVDKGFEMVAIIQEAHAPTGNLSLFVNFNKLFQLEMGHGKPLATPCPTSAPPLVFFAAATLRSTPSSSTYLSIKGLDEANNPVKQGFTICSEQFPGLTIEQVERKCGSYASATQNIQSDNAVAAAAAAKAAGTQTPHLHQPPGSWPQSASPAQPTSLRNILRSGSSPP